MSALRVPVGAKLADREVQPDEAARLPYRIELPVGEVAGGGADRVGVGMAGDERCRRELGHVPEAPLVQVRQIDHDAQRVAATDERLAGFREPRADVGRAGIPEGHPMRESVRAAPDGTDRAQARGMKDLERIEARVDGLGPLDVEHDGQGFLGHRGPNLGNRLTEAHGPRGCPHDALDRGAKSDRDALRFGE